MIPPKPATVFTTIILAGLGREGFSSYRYFAPLYPAMNWILSDELDLALLDEQWQSLAQQPSLRFVPLGQLAEQIQTLDPTTTLLVKTAGIPVEKPGIQAFLEAGATLTSNTATFFDACRMLPMPPRTIGVTGTKGKSTTASLIYHVLKENGVPAVLAGNIGVAPLETLNDKMLQQTDTSQSSVVILEMSSHQLRELDVSPEIAVIQDVTPEHLDFYASFESYLESKGAITRFQRSQDWLIYNPAYEAPSRLAHKSLAQKLGFSLEPTASAGDPANGLVVPVKVYLKDNWLWFEEQKIIAIEDIPLMGHHNLLNTMPAILIAEELFALPVEGIAKAIRTFVGLPHRIEYVGEVKGVRYYNDSQATTPEAAMAALASFPGKKIILLAGGSDKGVSFDALGAKILECAVQQLLLFPPMGEKILRAVKAAASQYPGSVIPPVQEVRLMAEAVQAAAASALPGSVVLLSPACASFGLFKNYQDRGDQFKAAVAALAKQ